MGAVFLGGREIAAESTKMLFFKENDTFQETQFWKVGVVVSNKKWFLLTHLLSFRIFACWKIRKCCFSSKIMHLTRHNFEEWVQSILKFALLNKRILVSKIENAFSWLIYILFQHLIPQRFLNNCFLIHIITLSKHSFEQWAWQVLDVTYIYGKVCFARQKMTFIQFLVFIANIWELKHLETFFFK